MVTTFLPLYKYIGFFQDAQPIQDLMIALVTCKNKEDAIKNKGARVVATLFIDFSDAEGQLTP